MKTTKTHFISSKLRTTFIMKNFTMTMTIIRNKNVISITVKRADYESKTPDYPGNHQIIELDQN